jgi:hypothetical protein
MNAFSFSELSDNQKNTFFNFCQIQSFEKNQPASVNMWSNNWQIDPQTLMYVLNYTDRFNYPNGDFTIVYDNDNIVACGGVYKSSFCNDLAIAGCRTWVEKNYRNKTVAREFLLPEHKKWAVKNNYKAIALSFNFYNKNIIHTWKRKRAGEIRFLRKPYHLFYNNFNEIEFSLNIQHTEQWIIYEKLDLNFEFDWDTIKF